MNRVRRELLRLAAPVLAQSFIGMLMFMADTAMLGRLGADADIALAAMVIVGPIMWLLGVLAQALGTGALAVVARRTGEGNIEEVRIQTALALRLALLAGSAVALALSSFASPLAHFFTEDAAVIGSVTGYIRIVSIGLIGSFVVQAGSGALRGMGDTLTPMVAGIVSNSLNIVGNYVLIFGKFGFPRLGIVGAALATAVSFLIYAALTLFFCARKKGPIGLRLRYLRLPRMSHLRQLLRVTLPATVHPMVYNFAYLFFTKIVTEYGVGVMASHRVAIAIESLSFIPGSAFIVATASLVGRYLGASKEDEVKKVISESFAVTALAMSFASLLFVLFPAYLCRIFTDRAELIPLASDALRIWAFEQLPLAFTMVLVGVFQGAGTTEFPLIAGAVGVWLARLLPAYLFLSSGYPVHFVWMTTVFDWLTQAVILYILYRKGLWRKAKI